MPDERLPGRVFVVAGRLPALTEVVDALTTAGSFVAFVSDTLSAPTAAAFFRADPTDATVWERVAPHVEQRLGPVDAVVIDAGAQEVVTQAFGVDLKRR